MGDLLIRNIPDALKRDIAARAEKNGNSLSDEAKSLLQRALVDAPGVLAAAPPPSVQIPQAAPSNAIVHAPEPAPAQPEPEPTPKPVPASPAPRACNAARSPLNAPTR